MMAPRWIKVLRDLFSNKVRSLLVVLSVGVGVFAVGLVVGLYSILLTDLNADYLSANPHGAIIYTSSFDEELLNTVRRMPGIGAAEGRSGISGFVQQPGGKRDTIAIQLLPEEGQMKIDVIRPTPPLTDLKVGSHEILIEGGSRAAMPQVKVGDSITVVIGETRARELRVAGFVHDVTTFPYALSNQLTGYVNADTIEWLGGSRQYSQLYLTVAENPKDEAHVNQVAQEVANKIERGGAEVYFTFVYQPGVHPASSFISAMMMLLGGLGLMAVFLSAFLVVNTFNALLSQHVRQIGMMKAIGADSNQLVGMYVVLVLCYGALAFIVAMPLAGLLAYSLANGFAQYLNFELAGFRFVPAAVILQLVVALLVPLLAAIGPVMTGTRLTVREAISNYGLAAGKLGRGAIDRLLDRIYFISRPLIISLRNTFRRKMRLALTLSTLTLAGAIFISIFNIRASMVVEINKTLGYFLSDVNLSLNQAYRYAEINQIAQRIPEVKRLEAWGITTAQVLSTDKDTATEVLIWAPPNDSQLIRPAMMTGRWLMPDDENAIVIGNHLLKKRPELKTGDSVVIKLRGKETTWKIVGTYQLTGNVEPPFVYANFNYLSKAVGAVDMSSEFRVITTSQDALTETRVAKSLEAALKARGIGVGQITTGAEQRLQQAAQIDILVYALLVMAVLIALVGGLGLMGTMSMNVLERTREIGVMRAVGASDFAIMKLVLVEGMLIGLLSWGVGALLSVPISTVLGNAVGVSLLTVPLRMTFSSDGFIIWLVGILILSTLASLLPARNAVRLTIRDVLAYE